MPPRKKQAFSHQQNIFIIANYGEFKSSTALRREFCKHFKLLPRQIPQSYVFSRDINRVMVSCNVSPSKLPGPPRTKIIKENIDIVRNLVEKKKLFHFRGVNSNAPVYGYCVEDFVEKIEKISISI